MVNTTRLLSPAFHKSNSSCAIGFDGRRATLQSRNSRTNEDGHSRGVHLATSIPGTESPPEVYGPMVVTVAATKQTLQERLWEILRSGICRQKFARIVGLPCRKEGPGA